MTRFRPNPDLTIDVTPIGASGEPVLIIDDFLSHPSDLVNAASQSPDWKDLPPGGYPGRRAALPGDYVRATLQRLDGPIRERLLSQDMKLDRFDCAFSMVNRAPETLSPLQRVPHIDIARPDRVAVLHYLCPARFGGTAFFRQDGTALEQIGPKERERYQRARSEGIALLQAEDTYPAQTTPGYQRTAYVEARFNRLIVFRSFTLHSGVIEDAQLLSNDPGIGRLTANFFVDYAPATPSEKLN